ncbi:hypothetical protein ACM26V_13905 [Salipaludibacillus sp. HK11]
MKKQTSVTSFTAKLDVSCETPAEERDRGNDSREGSFLVRGKRTVAV